MTRFARSRSRLRGDLREAGLWIVSAGPQRRVTAFSWRFTQAVPHSVANPKCSGFAFAIDSVPKPSTSLSFGGQSQPGTRLRRR